MGNLSFKRWRPPPPPPKSTLRLFLTPLLFLVALTTVSWGFVAGLLYLGAYWDPTARTNELKVAVLNQDAGFTNWSSLAGVVPAGALATQAAAGPFRAGSIAVSLLQTDPTLRQQFTWVFLNNATNTRDSLANNVIDGKYWVGLVFPQNYSEQIFLASAAVPANVPSALEAVIASEAAQATTSQTQYVVEYLFDQGINFNTANLVNARFAATVIPTLELELRVAVIQAVSPGLLTVLDPFFLVFPVNVVLTDFHEAQYGLNFAAFICYIVFFISSLLILSGINTAIQPGVTTVTKQPRTAVNVCFLLTMPLLLSELVIVLIACFLLLVLVIYGGTPFYSSAGLLWIWLVIIGTTILVINATIATVVGQPFVQHVLTMWIVINVRIAMLPLSPVIRAVLLIAGGAPIFALATAPGFFFYGYALPMYHHVRVFRTIVFGSLQNEVWESVGAIIAWLVVCSLLASIFGLITVRNFWNAKDKAPVQKKEPASGGTQEVEGGMPGDLLGASTAEQPNE